MEIILNHHQILFWLMVLYLEEQITIKIGGLISLFVPVSKVPLTKIKFDDDLE
jgi:hypothetical protein